MIIDTVRVKVVALPRRDPGWRTASYASDVVQGVYVAIEVDGVTGVGATAAHPRTMPCQTLTDALDDRVAPALAGTELSRAWQAIDALEGIPSRARIAVDLAMHDLLGKLAGVSAEVLWGGPARDRVKVVRMVGIKQPDEICDAVAPLYETGLRGFKLKIGQGVAADVDCVRRVRDQFGDDVTITVDANAAYDLENAQRLCAELADLKVACIEQPVSYKDIDAMATLKKTSSVPLMADQLVHTTADAVRVANLGAADVVSCKLTKSGSIAEAIRLLDVCTALGLVVHLGGSGAPAVMDSALTRLALARADFDSIAEVGESEALIDPHTSGVAYDGPWARSDGRPGLGGDDLVF